METGTLMALAMLSSMRARKGVKWCTGMVSGMRVALGMESMGAVPLRPDGLDATREALATFCEECGRCELGRR